MVDQRDRAPTTTPAADTTSAELEEELFGPATPPPPPPPDELPSTSICIREHPLVPGLLVARRALAPAEQASALRGALNAWFAAAWDAAGSGDDECESCQGDGVGDLDNCGGAGDSAGSESDCRNAPLASPPPDQAMVFGASALPAFVRPIADIAARMLPPAVLAERRALAALERRDRRCAETPASAATNADDEHDDSDSDDSAGVVLFDQLIANFYRPGQGLRDHVDLSRFDDGIAIASLAGPTVMRFRPLRTGGRKRAREDDDDDTNYAGNDAAAEGQRHRRRHRCRDDTENIDASAGAGSLDITSECGTASNPASDGEVCVLLRPGDVVCLTGPARSHWTHGIPARRFDPVPSSDDDDDDDDDNACCDAGADLSKVSGATLPSATADAAERQSRPPCHRGPASFVRRSRRVSITLRKLAWCGGVLDDNVPCTSAASAVPGAE
ncbi:hypothetical protein HK405_008334, partial [Cladochytrium tenue]